MSAGTPAFMSPELCGGQAYDGQLADVWAIGATMYMLKFGSPPFTASNVMSLYYKIQNDPLEFSTSINPNLKDLLEKMLVKAPNERYNMQQVSSHIWLLQPPMYSSADQIAMSADEWSQRKAMFHPPQSYSKAHEVAMSTLIKDLTKNDIFCSIGVGGVNHSEQQEDTEDIMQSGWGTDVFEKVNDDADFDNSSDDDDEDSPPSKPSITKRLSRFSGDEHDERKRSSMNSVHSVHDEMTTEEEVSREKKFRDKIARKSSNESKERKLSIGSDLGGDKPSVMHGLGKGLQIDTSVRAYRKKSQELQSVRLKGTGNESDNDDAEELTMTDFHQLMDTLGSQPKTIRPASSEIKDYALDMGRVSAAITNTRNGISAACHSEKGPRQTQEDRYLVLPEVVSLLSRAQKVGSPVKELDRISLACIFDGHNGGRTAELLVEKLSKKLVSNEMFLRQQWKDAITESFRQVDQEVLTCFVIYLF